jgi:UDP-GlcNAc:undecaprenyl-phosphate/decaprenyl-phosphate GlcNAc-1-phosphate transferase
MMYGDLLAFFIAFLASVGLTAPVRSLALRAGLVDKPGPRKVHVKPIPLLGGVAIYCGFALAVLVTMHESARGQIIGILAGATLVAVIGFLDDSGLLHHQLKLFVAMPAAALLLMAAGIRSHVLSAYVPGETGIILDGCLTVLWVVGITAAFSIFDHMDGLCAGVAAIAALFFTIAANQGGQVMVRTLGAAALGAALGFLGWNFKPAKIFMGDGGAMFLGFLMATLGLKLRPETGDSQAGWLIPVLILGVPIFDTTLVSISRARRGLIPFTSPGKDHTAHRLANLGLGQRGAVLALYALGGFFGSVAILIPMLSPAKAFGMAAVVGLCGLVAIYFLESAPYERQQKLPKPTAVP